MPALNIPLTSATKLFDSTKINLGPNVAEGISANVELKNTLWQYMLQEYVWPQLVARRPYEKLWDFLYDAYRKRLKISELKLKSSENQFIEAMLERAKSMEDMVLTDGLIFDTVDCLSGMAHYISWKDGRPVEFMSPEDLIRALQDLFYSPDRDKYMGANSILSWCLNKEHAFTQSRDSFRDYFLYGFGFMLSDFYFQLENNPQSGLNLRDIGMSYTPMSCRNVWVDWRIKIRDMKDQPCPFWFTHVPMFSILANPYDVTMNPMGYQNLDKIRNLEQQTNWFVGGEAWLNAVNARLQSIGFESGATAELGSYQKVNPLWSFYAMLPFDDKTGTFDPKTIPFRRYLLQVYGPDIVGGKIEFLRVQDVQDHYGDLPPIYGGTHLADLSSAAYSMSLCEVLLDSAQQVTELYNRALENKKQINQPPSWHMAGSPSVNQDVNKPNARIEVHGPQDFGWKTTIDATGSTVDLARSIREDARRTGRITDAILGQAMGARTTATESDNIYEASMSKLTTDISLLNTAFHGGYAERCWKLYGEWLDENLTKLITGQFGWPLSSEDLKLRISFRANVGERFLANKAKLQYTREMIGFAVQSPILDQAILWKEYTQIIGLPSLQRAIIDGGRDRQIELSKDQAMCIYINENSIIDPEQDHAIAVQVKIRFLQDANSVWNQRYASLPYLATGMPRAQALAQQIQMHNNFIMMQQMQKAAMMQQQMAAAIREQHAMAEASKPEPKPQS